MNDADTADEDAPTGLLARIAERSDRLTASDRKICEEVLRDPVQAAFRSAESIAQNANVHQASVVRLAQKLGFAGFASMRAALREEVRDQAAAATRLRRLVDRPDGADAGLNAFLAQQIGAIAAVERYVAADAMQQAAATLADARRVFVFASGHATALAELALRRLARIGLATVDLRLSRRDLIERLAGLGPGDAVLAFAFRRVPTDLPAILRVADDQGVATVGITDLLGAAIWPTAQTVLAAPRGRSDDYQTLLVPLALMEALAIAVAQAAPGRATQALDRIGAVAQRFDPGSSVRRVSDPLSQAKDTHRPAERKAPAKIQEEDQTP